MKTVARAVVGTICVWLAGIVTTYGVSYNFETNGLDGWTSSGATLTNVTIGSYASGSTQAVSIASVGTVSVTPLPAPGTKVITDFWTKPNPVLVPPITASDATVQFAFNGDESKVYALNGNDWTTNSVSVDLTGGTWIHVTVVQDYGTGTWSLKLNDTNTVASGLAFHVISPVQTEFSSFSIANGRGSAALLDDVLIVANTQTGLSNVLAAGDSGIFYTDSGAGGTILTGKTTAALAFQVIASDDYAGTVNVNTQELTSVGGIKEFTDDITAKTNRYYKLLVSADGGATVAAEPAPSYTMHKQFRVPNKYYWVGMMIDYGAGQNTLAGTLGTQLARGLTGGSDSPDGGDNVIIRDPTNSVDTFYLNDDRVWAKSGGSSGGNNVNTPIPIGGGVWVKTRTSSSGGTTVFAGPQIDNGVAQYSVKVAALGWNTISRPFEGAADISNAVPAAVNGDLMYLYRGGTYKILEKRPAGWRLYGSGASLPAGFTDLRFGEGVLYYSLGGNNSFTLK